MGGREGGNSSKENAFPMVSLNVHELLHQPDNTRLFSLDARKAKSFQVDRVQLWSDHNLNPPSCVFLRL